MLRHLFISRTFVVLAAIFWGAPASPGVNDTLQDRITVLRGRFVKEVRRCGITPQFVPKVTVVSTPAVISYDSTRRSIIVGRWETLPPPIQAFFAQWAAKAYPGRRAQYLFDALFNDFLVGHELGHWAADQSYRPATLDHYGAEIEANRYAIAFSDLRHPRETARITGRFSFLRTLPNPVPDSEDPRVWFNTHYDNLAQTNPLAYNWYQGLFMHEAWKLRRPGSFCKLLKVPTKGG